MTVQRYTTILAKSRTLLANERTLLSYWRTALSFLAIGFFLIKFFHQVVWYVTAGVFISFALIVFIFGTVKFYRYQKRIDQR